MTKGTITKGEWKFYEPEIEPNRVVIWSDLGENSMRSICRTFGYCDTKEEELANANLIVTAVNACKEINPDNPQVVAERIKDMYEALKDLAYSTSQNALDKYDIKEANRVLSQVNKKEE